MSVLQRYLVIEHFHPGAEAAIDQRFHSQGRLLPDGLKYIDSWRESVTAEQEQAQGMRCFQLMETAQFELFELWIQRWADLVDFEVIPLRGSHGN